MTRRGFFLGLTASFGLASTGPGCLSAGKRRGRRRTRRRGRRGDRRKGRREGRQEGREEAREEREEKLEQQQGQGEETVAASQVEEQVQVEPTETQGDPE